MYFYTDVIL